MRADHQALAYVMRRPARLSPAQLTPYYADVVGLPVVADHGSVVQHWMGENSLLKVTYGDDPPPWTDDVLAAPFVPVLRSHDLDATVARLTAAGLPPVATVDGSGGRTVFVVGPDRLPIGVEQRRADSSWAADVRARRQWADGPFRLGDLPPLPPDLHHLSRLLLRVPDVAETTDFYAGGLGLDVLGAEDGAQLLDLGEDVTLVVAPGGAPRPAPAARSQVPDSMTLRVHDLAALLADLEAVGVRPIGPVDEYRTGTRMTYVCDPAGTLVGLAQRADTGDVEDVEATRRWRRRSRGAG